LTTYQTCHRLFSGWCHSSIRRATCQTCQNKKNTLYSFDMDIRKKTFLFNWIFTQQQSIPFPLLVSKVCPRFSTSFLSCFSSTLSKIILTGKSTQARAHTHELTDTSLSLFLPQRCNYDLHPSISLSQTLSLTHFTISLFSYTPEYTHYLSHFP
jgi:hypothetical protein